MKFTVRTMSLLSMITLLAIPCATCAAGAEPAPVTKTLVFPVAPPDAKPLAPQPGATVTVAPVPSAETPAELKGLTVAAAAEKPAKLGYVDLSRFRGETSFGRAAHDKIQEKGEKLKAQITDRQKKLEKAKRDLEAKFPDLSAKERKTKAKEFEKKVEEYQTFVKKAEKDLETLETDMTRKLYDEIEKAAAEYGKANGLAAVVVKRELLYVGQGVDAVDVTAELLKIIEAKGLKP